MELKIEYLAVKDLKPYKKNANEKEINKSKWGNKRKAKENNE